MSKTVLVVAAHPDDEVLGCGATMTKHAEAGDDVHVVILGEGITSRDESRDKEKRKEELSGLEKVSIEANKALGVVSVEFHNFPGNRMDSIDILDIVKAVERNIDRVNPSVVYTHHASDLNIDHRIVSDAVVTASRPAPGCAIEEVLFFEVPSSTEWNFSITERIFAPNWFVDVTGKFESKLKALKIYKGEMRQWPHARSMEAVISLARWRGAAAGCEAAEAFVLGRKITK